MSGGNFHFHSNVPGAQAISGGSGDTSGLVNVLRWSLVVGISVLSTVKSIAADLLPVAKIDEDPIAANEVFTDTQPPYENLFRNARLDFSEDAKVGPARGELGFNGIKGAGFNFPLVDQGFRPEDAMVKIGPLYLDLKQIVGSVRVSDNVDWTYTNRRAGAVSVARADVAAALQLTPGIQAAVAGSLVWLPFRGKVGIAGFGINDQTLLDWSMSPIFKTELVGDFTAAGWDFQFGDIFTARPLQQFRTGIAGWNVFEGERFDERDISGRLNAFYTGMQTPIIDPAARRDLNDFQLVNDVFVRGDHETPLQTSLSIEAHHKNFWTYASELYGFPKTQDIVNARLTSERENMRFKPFVGHLWQRRTFEGRTEEFINNITYGGINGPVSENIDFFGMIGWMRSNQSPQENLVANVSVRHQFHPNAYHSFAYSRLAAEPDFYLMNSYRYELANRFGPYVHFQHVLALLDANSPNVPLSESKRYLAGSTAYYDLGDRTKLSAGYMYQRLQFENPLSDDATVHLARVALDRKLRETIHANIAYDFQSRDFTTVTRSFYVHSVTFSLSKTF